MAQRAGGVCSTILCLFLLLAACGGKEKAPLDPSLRARVDGLNKEAFLNRYSDIPRSLDCGWQALTLVNDSLPGYTDGRMRAFNNLAYAYYMLDMTDSAHACLDSVERLGPSGSNAEVEHTIAQLTRIRLLQRECRLAESYGLLHDVGDISSLRRQRHRNDANAYLYDFARMEYYITSLTLNYHYRNDAVASSSGTELTPDTRDRMQLILDRVEADMPSFKCDYSEVLALNYAIAHSHYRLAAVSTDKLPALSRAFQYIEHSQRILDMPGHYCDYHQANLYQLRAFIGADTSWGDDLLRLHDSLPLLPVSVDTVLDLFHRSTDMFFDTPDPYQHLGAVVAAAEYCLRVGDTVQAEDYYAMALADTTWRDGMAPKFEAMLYDGLLRSQLSTFDFRLSTWYDRQVSLLSFISKNEREDVLLQRRLDTSQSRNRFYAWATGIGAAFVIILTILVFMLRRRSVRLRRETLALQLAKRQDVERIANVETCLSVLRHDINPFLSYLQNKNLSPALRQEVLDQLLRTFDNIKNWTNLSIPSGLQFRAEYFPFDEVAASAVAQCLNPRPDTVRVVVKPSGITLWGDRLLVEILLRNLVANALQHTAEGSVTIKCENVEMCECVSEAKPLKHSNINTLTHSRFAHITVADTGTGMDAETLENLFRADKPLNAANTASAQIVNPDTGHGFGLILCRYIIKLHDDNTLRGCRIWAESHQQSDAAGEHTPQSLRDSSPNLGEQPEIQTACGFDSDRGNRRSATDSGASHSSPKLGEVAQRAGGVCPTNSQHGTIMHVHLALQP